MTSHTRGFQWFSMHVNDVRGRVSMKMGFVEGVKRMIHYHFAIVFGVHFAFDRKTKLSSPCLLFSYRRYIIHSKTIINVTQTPLVLYI